MKNLHLTLACEDYDRMRPLKDGIVKPEGIELNYMVMSVEEIFWRMMKYEEFDVSELSMGAFLTAASRGRRPFVAIPVFPSRTFRHRCIFVNTDSGVKSFKICDGRRMGVPEYSMTAAVWLRGMFEHEYGVPPSAIHWVQAGEEHPGRKDRVDFEMPAGVTMESRPDTTLNVMIENGEIDAMMSPRMPTCFLQGSPKVKRLFPNYRQVEMEYFQKHRPVPDHACPGDQAVDLRKRSLGGADVVQSLLRVERDLHARSLRHQYTARRFALDFSRVRRHCRADDDRLLALWPGAQPPES